MSYDFAFWPSALTGITITLLVHTRLRPVVARIGIALLFPFLMSGCNKESPRAPPEAVASRLTACATTGVCKGEFILTGTYPPVDDQLLVVRCTCHEDGVCRWCIPGICTDECIP